MNEIAPAERRAEVVSTYFMACFIGNSVPVIGIGVVTTLASPLTAGIAFAAAVGAFAAAALVFGARPRDDVGGAGVRASTAGSGRRPGAGSAPA